MVLRAFASQTPGAAIHVVRCEVEDEAHHSFTRDSFLSGADRTGRCEMRRLEFGVSGSKPKVRSLGGTSAGGLAFLAGLLVTDKGGGRDIIVASHTVAGHWLGLGMASRMAQGQWHPPVSSPRLPHRALPQIKGGEAGHIPPQREPPLHGRGTNGKRKGTVFSICECYSYMLIRNDTRL